VTERAASTRDTRPGATSRGGAGIRRISLLGGSTPFAVGLIDAIVNAPGSIEPSRLVLFGRDADAMSLVASYGRAALEPLGWEVSDTRDLQAALEATDIVIHQIRYGGLEGRREDERLAAAFRLPADETIGPAGLSAAIRMAPGHRVLARSLVRLCPKALCLNLTNPLSCSTTLLNRWGARQVVGLCELPQVTMRVVCDVLGLRIEDVDWSYMGLNHRGFIHHISADGRDLLEDLLERLGDRTIGGITREEIRGVGAVPMKHLALFRTRPPRSSSRAEGLVRLRRVILEELRARPLRSPPSIVKRPQPWYRDAVVPMLNAIGQTSFRRLVVNVLMEDGIVHEVPAAISSAAVIPEQGPPAPRGVVGWVERFVEHERLVVDAAADPSSAAIHAAVDADPLVPRSLVDAVARRVFEGSSVQTVATDPS
jgi:6-phospho-beta-glucosidase